MAAAGTETEAGAATARRLVAWYERRRTIEECFKVLETGTRVEDRRLDHADDLRPCLVFDAVTACRVLDLERRVRDKPELPADRVVGKDRIVVLHVLRRAHGIARAWPPPEKPPGIRTFVIDLARLAGFEPRKIQPLPGTRLPWKGCVFMRNAADTYRALSEPGMIQRPPDRTAGG